MSVLINPYCKLTELKSFLKLPLNDAGQDDLLIDAINGASRLIDDETYDKFYRQDFTDKIIDFQSVGRDNFSIMPAVRNLQYGFIQTPYRPIISITELKEAIQYPNAGTMSVLTENTDFIVDYPNGIIYRVCKDWMRLQNSIKITCSLGYDNGTNPYDNSIPSNNIPGLIRFHCIRIAAVYTGLWRRDVYSQWTGSKTALNVMELDEKWITTLRAWRMRR